MFYHAYILYVCHLRKPCPWYIVYLVNHNMEYTHSLSYLLKRQSSYYKPSKAFFTDTSSSGSVSTPRSLHSLLIGDHFIDLSGRTPWTLDSAVISNLPLGRNTNNVERTWHLWPRDRLPYTRLSLYLRIPYLILSFLVFKESHSWLSIQGIVLSNFHELIINLFSEK